jgi:hypothetical protein
MRFYARFWVIATAVLVLVFLTLAGVGLYLMYPTLEAPPPPRFPPPRDLSQANAQDLAYLKLAMRQMDRSFSPTARAAFDSQVDVLAAHPGALDAGALEMGVARSVALADNGHTGALGLTRGLTGNSVPMRAYWFADGLHVVQTDRANADILGSRVVQVAGRTPDELAVLARDLVGGSPSLAAEFSIFLMESPQALHAMGLQASPTETALTLQTPHGDIIERRLVADPDPVTGKPPPKTAQTLVFDPRELDWPRRNLSPVRAPPNAPFPQPIGDGRSWVHVLDGKSAALSLQQANSFYWGAPVMSGTAMFVQINAVMDQPGRPPLKAFLADTLRTITARRIRFVIVDLRSNPGGSYPLAADFADDLPRRLPANGKLFILTSANTFSAGVITAARLKALAGPRAQVVGGLAGDRLRFWAEASQRIVLPNSGLRVGYAAGYHDWKNGCSLADLLRCYPPNYLYAAAAGDIDPAEPLAWSFADYLNGRDTVLDRVEQIIAAS